MAGDLRCRLVQGGLQLMLLGIVTALLPLATVCSAPQAEFKEARGRRRKAFQPREKGSKKSCGVFPATETQAEIKCYELEKTEGEKGYSTEEKQNAFIMAPRPDSSHQAQKAPYGALTAGRKLLFPRNGSHLVLQIASNTSCES